MIDYLFKRYLPIYFKFLPGYWLAIWSAPVRYSGRWKIDKEWIPVYRNDSAWKALRITIRKGEFHSIPVIVFKRGVT